MNEIWITISFDGQPMDNITANSEEEAKDLIKSVEQNGFSGMNEEIQNDWINMGFNNNPTVKAEITGKY